MRIIAGEAKGRRLFAPDGRDTRPTTDRVREAIFNIIANDVPDARVLDLFAGSGAMALEALSRGAAHAVINDLSRAASLVIRRNVELVGWADRCTLLQGDWRSALPALRGQQFSLVFLDPPYRMGEVYGQVATALSDMSLLAEDALFVMEHGVASPLLLPPTFSMFDERRYGDIAVSLVARA